MAMSKEDLKDLLLGKAIRYLKMKSINFDYYKLLNEVNLIYENNVSYESYNLDNMIKDLWNYCSNIEK